MPLPRHPPSNPSRFDMELFKAWQEQKKIGWRQIFRGQISAGWAKAQGMYYKEHPDLRYLPQYSSDQWGKQVIKALIEASLALWNARNQALHGLSPEDQRKIQRQQTIALVQIKFTEGIRTVQRKFPTLYREPCITLCDRSTLQLLKWVETYEDCRKYIDREVTKERQRLIRIVKRAYRNKNSITGYGKVSLFGETKATLIRRSTTFLKGWVAKYLEHTAKTIPIANTHTRLVDIMYC